MKLSCEFADRLDFQVIIANLHNFTYVGSPFALELSENFNFKYTKFIINLCMVL